METLWERSRHAFEKTLGEGEKAAERMIGEMARRDEEFIKAGSRLAAE